MYNSKQLGKKFKDKKVVNTERPSITSKPSPSKQPPTVNKPSSRSGASDKSKAFANAAKKRVARKLRRRRPKK